MSSFLPEIKIQTQGNIIQINKQPISIEPKKTYHSKTKFFINNSVRMPTMNNCLNYTFRFDKSTLTSNSQLNNKKSLNEFLFDLESTYVINQELVITIIQTLPSLSQNQKRKLLKSFEFIQDCFNKKKENRKEKRKLASKILINKQIVEESKRRNDENYIYFKDQLEDIKENIGKKTASIKQFHKKFFEVEVFVQREARNNLKMFGRYCTFQIVPFISNNEVLIKFRNKKDKETNKCKLKNQLMSNEINEIRLTYKTIKLSQIEEIEKGLIYIQKKNEYLNGLFLCFIGSKYRYRYKDNTTKENNDNYEKKYTESYAKRLLTMDGNVIEKQITEISIIEDEKNYPNKYEMLETENINVDIKENY